MKNSIVCALLLFVAAVPTAGAGAQDESLRAAQFGRVEGRRSSVELKAGAALALATTAVGSETGTDVGPLFSGVLGLPLSHRTDLTAEVSWQPFKAHNPVADEAFRAVYGLAGVQVSLGSAWRVYVRPSLGVVVRSWSGSQVFVGSETSLAAALAIGAEFPAGQGLRVAPEAFARLSGAEELSTGLYGLGVSLMWGRPQAR
jgi:hypothetical protein